MLDVSIYTPDPVVGVARGGRKIIYNYRSKRFGVVDMVVEMVEPDPIQESLVYLYKRSLRA
jgi:hypothetical protein